jgi:Tfp pilus assembly protein PilF
MKKIITAVMTGIVAVSMSGCAMFRNSYVPLKIAVLAAEYAIAAPRPAPVARIKVEKHVYAKALVVLGDKAYRSGDFKKALGHYDEALREWDDYIIYVKIAFCLKKMGNVTDAKMVYKKAMKMKPVIALNKNKQEVF